MKKNLTILLENGKVFTNIFDDICKRDDVIVVPTGVGNDCWVHLKPKKDENNND